MAVSTTTPEHLQLTIDTSFMCPYCSKCSLEQYLSEEGCPEATGKTLFPYLNTKELSEEDREELEDTLVSATKDLQDRFSYTDAYVAQNLCADFMEVKNFALDLVGDLEQKENITLIEDATSIPEIIFALQPYKSFLNYEIIEEVVVAFGSPENCTEMQKYVTAFNDFSRKSAFELPISALSKQWNKRNENILTVKFPKKGFVSLRGILAVRQAVASACEWKNWALNLCSIEDESDVRVALRFLVPAAVMDKNLLLSSAKISAPREVGIYCEEEQATYTNADYK